MTTLAKRLAEDERLHAEGVAHPIYGLSEQRLLARTRLLQLAYACASEVLCGHGANLSAVEQLPDNTIQNVAARIAAYMAHQLGLPPVRAEEYRS